MTSVRLDIRLDAKIKANAEKAAALLGHKSLTDYVITIMNENSAKVIAQYESMTVENDVFDRFMSACDKAAKPNLALTAAAQFAKDQGFNCLLFSEFLLVKNSLMLISRLLTVR